MAKKVQRKRKTTAKRKRKSAASRKFPMRIFSFLILVGLLLLSMGAAGYVIFFKTTVAYGSEPGDAITNIAFEEPYSNIPELPADIPPAQDTSLPMVAIIIDDMGYHQKIGNQLLELPMNLTFSFLAAAPFTAELEEKAYQSGRCIFLHLPMEPKSKEWDPGPGALFIGQSREEQAELFRRNLQGVPHAVGVNNHMGSLYTESRESMESLMQLLKEQGLLFIDSFTTGNSQGIQAAVAAGVPTARRHIFLDNVHSQDRVCAQLQQLVNHAEEKGWAIGIGHPNDATLAALTNCRGRLLGRVQLVSVQELLLKL